MGKVSVLRSLQCITSLMYSLTSLAGKHGLYASACSQAYRLTGPEPSFLPLPLSVTRALSLQNEDTGLLWLRATACEAHSSGPQRRENMEEGLKSGVPFHCHHIPRPVDVCEIDLGARVTETHSSIRWDIVNECYDLKTWAAGMRLWIWIESDERLVKPMWNLYLDLLHKYRCLVMFFCLFVFFSQQHSV